MISKTLYPLYIFLILISCFLLRQEVAYAIQADTAYKTLHFTTENGLPSNKVYSCMQDHNGYIWMATDKGVVKYNGHTFRIFTTADGLPKNDIWRLYEDTRGRIWLFTYAADMGYIKNNVFKNVLSSNNELRINGIVSSEGYTVLKHMMWLYVIDGNDNLLPIPAAERMVDYKVGMDDKMYGLDIYSKSYYFDLKDNKLVVKVACGVNPDNWTSKLTSYIVGDMHMIGYNHEYSTIEVFDINRCKRSTILLRDYGAEDDEKIYLAAMYSQGKGYFILTNKRIYNMDEKAQITSVWAFADLVPGNSKFSYFITDDFLNNWISTTENGVFMKFPSNRVFLPEKRIEVLSGSRYVGQIEGRLTFWYHKGRGKLYGINQNGNIEYEHSFGRDVLCVSPCSDSSVYVSFLTSVYMHNIKNKKTTDFLYNIPMQTHGYVSGVERSGKRTEMNPDITRSYYTRNVRFLHHYSDSVFYRTTYTDFSRHTVHKDSTILNVIESNRFINTIFDSINNCYWAYTTNSIFVYLPQERKAININRNYLDLLSIKNIEAMCADDHGNVYVLSDHRLSVFNSRTLWYKSIAVNTVTDGAVMAVYKNRVIVGSQFGLLYIDFKSNPAIKYIHNSFSCHYKDVYDLIVNERGDAFFNTDKGVYTFSCDSLPVNDMHDFRGNGLANLVLSYGMTERRLNNRDTILIPADENRFSFDFIDFYDNDDPVYKYRIDGGRWETTKTGEVFYGKAPGYYSHVECIISNKLWSSKKYSFYVQRIPHWWQTDTWKRVFVVGGILLLAGLGIIIALITRYYVRKNNEKKQALTDMELRALYAQINPHFIFNTLGTAQFFINRQKMDEAYNHVNKFSRLLRAYLKASGNRYVNLAEEIALLKDYIELQQIRFEDKFDYRIDIDNKLAKDSMQIPTLLLQPLVENAINHGLFHLPDGVKGLLHLSFKQGKSSEELICIIEDNGVGRERSKSIKKDNTIDKDASYGTTLTKKLIDIFKEYEKMDIYLEYTDKPSPETGTIVKLTIGNIKYVA